MMRLMDGLYANIGEIALLIARLNQIAIHHVGYCGENAEEIIKTLSTEWEELTFSRYVTIAYEDTKIVGALLLDMDSENNSAELWGPFIDTDDYEIWCEMANQMWNHTIHKQKKSKTKISSFYNIHNQNAIAWIQQWNTGHQEEYLVLTMNQEIALASIYPTDTVINSDKDIYIKDIQMLTEPIRTQLQLLHEKSFGDTYYSIDTIEQRLNDENKLLLLIHQEACIGYVYMESDYNFREGDIEYIAVDEHYKKQGYGTILLRQALNYLFYSTPTQEVTLCVNLDKTAVIRLYRKLGFTTKYQLRRSLIHV